MSIATALTALADDVSAAKAAITAKGGTAPDGTADMADAIAAIPSGGITPSGSVTLTEEGSYNVTEKAQAVVDMSATRANLAEAVTAKGVDTLPTASFDTIAVNIGLISGGGGLPSVINKLGGGSFTLPSDTAIGSYNISHNLGENVKGFSIWSDNPGGTYDVYTLKNANLITASAVAYSYFTSDTTERTLTNATFSTTATAFKIARVQIHYKAGITYKWIAWA